MLLFPLLCWGSVFSSCFINVLLIVLSSFKIMLMRKRVIALI